MSRMTSGVVGTPLSQVDTPLLAVALAQGSAVPASLTDLDGAAGGVVARAITSGDFKGKRDEATLLYPSGVKPERILLVGLGKPGEVTRNSIRRAIWARRWSKGPRKAPGRSPSSRPRPTSRSPRSRASRWWAIRRR